MLRRHGISEKIIMKTTIIKSPEIIPEAVTEKKEEEKYRVVILTARPFT